MPSDVRGPVFAQPKLNGLRCWYSPSDGAMYLRGGGVITSCPHLLRACLASGLPVDGELYVHGWPLERIRRAVQRMRPCDDSLQVRLHAFDLVQRDAAQSARLDTLAGATLADGIERVPTVFVGDASTLDGMYGQYLAAGYEGIIMRPVSGVYAPGVRATFKCKPVWD